MMKRFLISALMMAVASGAVAGGDPVAGKKKATLCIGCHGADGNSSNPDWPSLAGQGEGYLAKQINDFKSGARKDGTMNAMVGSLSDADVANVSAFFASNKGKLGSTAKDQVELGKQIYRAGIADRGIAACASCHGPTGAGNPAAKFPALSGQHAKYTIKALKDFSTGARENDLNGMMRDVAGKLKDAEMKAVSEYVSGLH